MSDIQTRVQELVSDIVCCTTNGRMTPSECEAAVLALVESERAELLAACEAFVEHAPLPTCELTGLVAAIANARNTEER